jgi:hypothetical protein
MQPATRVKTVAALALAGGALAALSPPSAAAEVTVVAFPPSPIVGAPG